MKNLLNSYFLQNFQNKYHDSKTIASILLAIVQDLEILQEAFIFKGLFCPLIEHKAPNLTLEDSIHPNMSLAQRSHQFHMIGRRIINNCSYIINITPSHHLPLITQNCQNLKMFLSYKDSENSKTFLEIKTNELMTSPNIDFEDIISGLQKYHLEFDKIIPQELPTLAHQSWLSYIWLILWVAVSIKTALELLSFVTKSLQYLQKGYF